MLQKYSYEIGNRQKNWTLHEVGRSNSISSGLYIKAGASLLYRILAAACRGQKSEILLAFAVSQKKLFGFDQKPYDREWNFDFCSGQSSDLALDFAPDWILLVNIM